MSSSLLIYSSAPKTKRIFQILWYLFELSIPIYPFLPSVLSANRVWDIGIKSLLFCDNIASLKKKWVFKQMPSAVGGALACWEKLEDKNRKWLFFLSKYSKMTMCPTNFRSDQCFFWTYFVLQTLVTLPMLQHWRNPMELRSMDSLTQIN